MVYVRAFTELSVRSTLWVSMLYCVIVKKIDVIPRYLSPFIVRHTGGDDTATLRFPHR